MNKIIERLEAIAEGDPWKMRDSLRIFIDELKEERDSATQSKAIEVMTKDAMIEMGKEAVKEFDSV